MRPLTALEIKMYECMCRQLEAGEIRRGLRNSYTISEILFIKVLDKRIMEKEMISGPIQSNALGDQNALNKRPLPKSDVTHPLKMTHMSRPLAPESRAGPSTRSTTRNQVSADPSSRNNAMPQAGHRTKASNVTVKHDSGRNPLESPINPDRGSIRFDVTFASWLEGEKVSRGAKDRLIKDPTL